MARRHAGKVALYLPSLAGGRAERVTVKLAHGLAQRGLGVALVLAKAAPPYLAEAAADVRVIDLGAHRVLASLPQLVTCLRREKPDAMRFAMGHANIVALWAKRLVRVSTRLIVSVRVSWQNDKCSKVRKARLFPRLESRFYPWADRIVAVSQGVTENLSRSTRLPRERITSSTIPWSRMR